jgi:bifunctional UDP-N-acetylglucosamine pyrophosphorylase/glucosamine-1-phosphate N-acetyltransferase
MNNLRTLILAAGKGTRMKSKKAKVLHQVGGATLIEHVLWAAKALTPDIWLVVGHQADKVRSLVPEAKFVEQSEQLGTGHAVLMAREHFAGYTGDLLILPGDATLITSETLSSFLGFHRDGGYAATVLTAEIPDSTGYGRIVRGDNGVESIIEHRDGTPEILKICEINSSIYVFDSPALFEALSKVRNSNTQREYYLTDVIAILVAQRQRVGAFRVTHAEEILGINTRQELAAVDRLMRTQKCEALMASGVTIMDPANTFIDARVEIGPDSVLYPSVQIYGETVIGEDVEIHSFSRISNSRIGAHSSVLESCVIDDSVVGENVTIGPFARLRPETKLEEGVKVGNFVEIKKTTVGRGTKAMHLAYLGDATIGKNVNIGAGTITCNYDGIHKHPTYIEDGVFVGSDTQLIAPVRIGKDAYVGAGSSITDDVPPESLAIARGRQTVKEGWVRQKKEKSNR